MAIADSENYYSDEKVANIVDACKWKDIEKLRISATSEGGLVSDDIRRQACSCHLEEGFSWTLTDLEQGHCS